MKKYVADLGKHMLNFGNQRHNHIEITVKNLQAQALSVARSFLELWRH